MGDIRREFYELVMDYVPDINPAITETRLHVLRAAQWLSTLTPLMQVVDGQTDRVKGNVRPAVVAGFIMELLRLEDESDLSLTLVSGDDAGNLPWEARDYHTLFNRLVNEELERLDDQATERLGYEAVTRLREQLMQKLYSPLSTCLMRQYPEFFAAADLNLAVNVIHGSYTLISAFVTAVILDDEQTVVWLMPIIRQLSMCLPIGAVGDDPSDWVALTPS